MDSLPPDLVSKLMTLPGWLIIWAIALLLRVRKHQKCDGARITVIEGKLGIKPPPCDQSPPLGTGVI